MGAVIQRVSQVAASAGQQEIGKIGCGLLILLGVYEIDMPEDVEYLVKKIAQMRIFEDDQGKMNVSVGDVGGQILSAFQFTLFAGTRKENRPNFVEAVRPEIAIPLYELSNEGIRGRGITVATEQPGTDTLISFVNDGPIATIIDSKNR